MPVTYFSKRCSVCAYSKVNKDFHKDLLNTKPFEINNKDTVMDVWKRYDHGFAYATVVQHVRRHLIEAYKRNKEDGIKLSMIKGKKLVNEDMLQRALAGSEGSIKFHEQALDKFIDEFDALVKKGDIKITAQAGLQAIKIKADIEAKGKDQKLDLAKMFVGMNKSGGNDQSQDTA